METVWTHSIYSFLLEKLNHNNIEGWIYDRLGVETTQLGFFLQFTAVSYIQNALKANLTAWTSCKNHFYKCS